MKITSVDYAANKESGLDGFNFTFIKAAWDELKEDFCQLLSRFHQRGRLKREINATFLCLIPTVPNLVGLKDFRPISLVH